MSTRLVMRVAVVTAGLLLIAAPLRAQDDCAAEPAAPAPSELALCGEAWLARADSQLNRYYRGALAELGAEQRAALRTAQRAWLAFRDAQVALEASLLEASPPMTNPSLVLLQTQLALTRERARLLRGLCNARCP